MCMGAERPKFIWTEADREPAATRPQSARHGIQNARAGAARTYARYCIARRAARRARSSSSKVVEVQFEWTNTLPHENALFWGLCDEGFNGDRLQRFIAGYQPPTKPVPARNGTYAPSPRRLATKCPGGD